MDCKVADRIINKLCRLPDTFEKFSNSVDIICPPNVPNCKNDPYFVLAPFREFIVEYLLLHSKAITCVHFSELVIAIREKMVPFLMYGKPTGRFKKSYPESYQIQGTFDPKDDPKCEFIYIPLHLVIFDESNEMVAAHSTILLVDNKNKTIEYFDPNGPSKTSYFHQGEDAAREIATKYYPTHKFIPMIDFCPLFGDLTQFAGRPYCAHWSLLYAYIRTYCPNLSRKEIVNLLLEKEEEGYDLVYKFTCFLWELGIETDIIPLAIKYQKTNTESVRKELRKIIIS